ncbi:MAG TPA: PSD1 and planctomycete cytochrome C domain-containing protein [Gemmataceae bacterium]|nr:PSD1 and planctomycete cytochrome C domain-containing protein [Gemmataceae bacterium]
MKALASALAASLLAIPGLAAEPADYLRDVKPILARHCAACHGPDKQRASLRLDTAAGARTGGDSGPAVVPGKADASRLIQAVTGAEGVKAMPPKGPRLTAKEIAVLRAWIDAGAKGPANEIAEGPKKTHWAFLPPVRRDPPAVKNADWVRNPIDRFILARLEKQGIAPSPEADRITLVRRATLDLTGLPPTPEEVDAALRDPSPDWYEKVVDRLLASPHYGERMGRHWLDLARYADSNGYSIDSPRSIWPYRDWVIAALNADKPFDQFTIEQLAGDLLPNATVEQKVATGFHRNTQINEEGGIDREQFRVESIIDRVNTTGAVWLGLTIGCCQCHNHKFDPFTQKEYYQLFAFLNNADEPTLELGSPEQVALRKRVRAEMARVRRQLKPLDTTSPAKEDLWEKRLTTDLRKLLPADVQAILEVPENGRTAEQKERLSAAYRRSDMAKHLVAPLANPSPLAAAAHLHLAATRYRLDKELTALKKREPQLASTMVMQERKAPRQTYVMLGGDFTRKGATVSPGVPAVLHSLSASGGVDPRRADLRRDQPGGSPGKAPNRLDLARWLVDPRNPLTARVTVNRIWQHHFGLGIVETENDFGTQGTPPSHPELLDWLATEFMASGGDQARRDQPGGSPQASGGVGPRRAWSMKAMHRLIVTSATYRQSSKARPELATVDARNRLLARQNRLRLEAEFVRDTALAASGLLTRKVGGPSVFPPQPEGIYRFTQIDKHWKATTGPDRYRRGLYTYFWRSAPHPSLTVFDAPDASSTCTRRNRSNTPLQALTLLNDQGYFELAQGLAARVLREVKGGDADRLRYAFRLCLARPPSAREQKRLGDLLARQVEEFTASPEEARRMAGMGMPPGVDMRQHAAWTTVARVLLNLDEFITRE